LHGFVGKTKTKKINAADKRDVQTVSIEDLEVPCRGLESTILVEKQIQQNSASASTKTLGPYSHQSQSPSSLGSFSRHVLLVNTKHFSNIFRLPKATIIAIRRPPPPPPPRGWGGAGF